MKRTMQKAILAMLIVALLGAGSLFVTSAVTNTNPLEYFSSVRVADTADGTPKISEAQESVQLAPLAKINEEQARANALREVKGAVKKVELDNENGNVVYSVEMTTKDKKEIDVKVDAGNGKILKVENDASDLKENEINEKKEKPEGKEVTGGVDNDNIEHEFEGEEEQED